MKKTHRFVSLILVTLAISITLTWAFREADQGYGPTLIRAYRTIAHGATGFLFGALALFQFFFEELDGKIYKRTEYGHVSLIICGILALFAGASTIIQEIIEVVQHLL